MTHRRDKIGVTCEPWRGVLECPFEVDAALGIKGVIDPQPVALERGGAGAYRRQDALVDVAIERVGVVGDERRESAKAMGDFDHTLEDKILIFIQRERDPP